MTAIPDVAQDEERLGLVLQGIGPAPMTNSRGNKKLNVKCKKWILELIALVPSPSLAAKHLGITASTIQRERQRDPEFKRAYDEAKAIGNENVASLVYEQAAGLGIAYEVVKEGSNSRIVAVPQERSEKMLEMLFKMQHKDVFFTSNVNVSGSLDQAPPGSLCIYVEPAQLLKLSKDEQKQLTTIITKLEAMKPRTINGESVHVEAPEPQRIAHG